MRLPRLFVLLPLGVLLSASCADDGQVLGSRGAGAGAGAGGSGASAGSGAGMASGGKSGSGGETTGGNGATGGSAGSGASGGSGGATGGSGAAGGSAGDGATGGSSASGGTANAGASGESSGATGGDAATGGTGTAGDGASGGTSGGAAGASSHPCGASEACDLFPTNCCGYCGASTIDQWFAVADEDLADYQNSCSNIACAGCVTRYMPNFAAVCRDGECIAIDVTVDELAACNVNEDCALRWGTGCCQACDMNSTDLIAVSRTANTTAAFCGKAVPPCCGPAAFPSNARAACIDGFCRVGIN